MKHNIFNSTILFFLSFFMLSCQEDDPIRPLTGDWEYSSPYIVFGYAADSIRVETMPGQQLALDVNSVKGMLTGLAAEKMAAYFKGISFLPNQKLKINMQMGPVSIGMGASYLQSADILQVQLDTNDLKKLMPEGYTNIPKLSLMYRQGTDELCIYLSRVYLVTMVYMMEEQLIDRMASSIAEKIPEPVRPMVIPKIKESLARQIPQILDQVEELEIGFHLKIKRS